MDFLWHCADQNTAVVLTLMYVVQPRAVNLSEAPSLGMHQRLAPRGCVCVWFVCLVDVGRPAAPCCLQLFCVGLTN